MYLGKFLPNSSGFVANTANPTVTDRRPQEVACWLLGNVERNGQWPQNTNNNEAGLNITNALENQDGQFVWYVWFLRPLSMILRPGVHCVRIDLADVGSL